MAIVPSETATSTIVLVGGFNPAILQPRWLETAEAVPHEEADAADATGQIFVSRDVSLVQFRSYVLEATQDRFTLTTTPEAETALLLRDAAVNIFTLLSHTPIKLVGMNHSRHIELDEGGWEALREKLAPAAPWQQVIENPALTSVSTTGDRTDDLNGWLRVTVEPSVAIVGGLWVSINDHVDLGDETKGATRAVEVLNEHWEQSLNRAEDLIDEIRGIA